MNLIKKLFIPDKNFYKTVAGIAIPIALQNFITTGVNMMDSVMIGMVGETELSAVSLANQFISIYQILCMGIGLGASVLVSRYYGMKEMGALKKAVAIMIRMSIGLAAVFGLITLMKTEQVMRIYTTENDIIRLGVQYLRYSVATYFLLGLSLNCTIVLRSVGQVKISLFTSIAAFFVNVSANYIFIFGKFGVPAMGVAGAAIGTLIARLLEFSIICGYLLFADNRMSFRIRHLFIKTGDLRKEYIRISIPVLLSDAIHALGHNFFVMIIGRLGASFVAANAITGVTQQLSSVVIQGFSEAGAIVTGITLGEGNKEKAKEQGYALLGLGFLFGLISSGIIMSISDLMIRAYNISPETEEIARELMSAMVIITLFTATNSIMTKGVLRGGGDTKMLVIVENLFAWVVAIPFGVLAGFVWHLSAFWIYIFLLSDQILKAVWGVFRFRSGKWIKKISAGTNEEAV